MERMPKNGDAGYIVLGEIYTTAMFAVYDLMYVRH